MILGPGNKWKTVGFFVWICLVSIIFYAIFHQDNFFEKEAENIATLTRKRGDVLYRHEGLVRWRDAIDNHVFHDGDWVATAPGSVGDLEFRSGQKLKLGPETQIQIRSIVQGKSDYSFMITLSRGAVVADVKKPAKRQESQESKGNFLNLRSKVNSERLQEGVDERVIPSLVVRAGNTSVNIGSGSQMGLVKEAGNKEIQKFVIKSSQDKVPFFDRKTHSSTSVNSNFIPPSAKIFPEKRGAIFFVREAALPSPISHPPTLAAVRLDRVSLANLSRKVLSSPPPPKLAPQRLPAQAAVMRRPILMSKANSRPKNDPKVDLKALGYEFMLKIPEGNVIFYTDGQLSTLSPLNIHLPLERPKKVPIMGILRPLVEVMPRQGSMAHILDGEAFTDANIGLPLSAVVSFGRETFIGAFKEYRVLIRGGSRLTSEKNRSEVFTANYSTLRVRGYANLPRRSLTIGLDRLEIPSNLSTPWIMAKRDIEPDRAAIRIALQNGDDLPKMMPFIRSAQEVGVTDDGPRDQVGIFVVRKQAVIAEVSGPSLNKEAMEVLLKYLDGDFVFRGPKSALHEFHEKSQQDFASWVEASLDLGKVLYVMKRKKIYPVSREFIKTNNEVAHFIDAQAGAVFVEKVDVLAYR